MIAWFLMKLFSQNLPKVNIDISIVLVNTNNKDLVLGCLESIEKEARSLSFEVLLSDNGSKDGSVESFKALRKEKFWKDKLKLTLNDSNIGYAKANNQGITKARGKYVFLLNDDTIIHKGAIQNLISFADETPDAGVIGSRLLNIDGTLQGSCYHFPTITRAIEEYWFGHKGYFEKFAPEGDKPVAVDSVVGASFLITPEAQKRVGKFLDERYFAYFEDIDYCRQVWRKKLKVYYLPSSVITHYHGATFSKLADEGQRWKKLIPSSKIYHGIFKHYIINGVLWLGQKWQRVFG